MICKFCCTKTQVGILEGNENTDFAITSLSAITFPFAETLAIFPSLLFYSILLLGLQKSLVHIRRDLVIFIDQNLAYEQFVLF